VRGLTLPPVAAPVAGAGYSQLRNMVSQVPNPAAHKHHSYIQHLAVPHGTLPETVDGTLPDARRLADKARSRAPVPTRGVRSRVHPLAAQAPALESFKRAFELSDELMEPKAKKPRAAKVEVPTSIAGWLVRAAPRPRLHDAARAPERVLALHATSGCAHAQVVHERGELAGLTNPTLKGYCSENKLPQTGKKDDLVARVTEHLATRAIEEAAVVAAQLGSPVKDEP
jgi:hypothetical protein